MPLVCVLQFSCKLAMGLFLQGREHWQLCRSQESAKCSLPPKIQANHMLNECERLGGTDPISTEEIQNFPMVLMVRLILK